MIRKVCIACICLSVFASHRLRQNRFANAHEFRPTAQGAIVAPSAKMELLWDNGEFTEGPVATPDGAILFSDIGNRIMRCDPATLKVTVFREKSGKSNGLAFDAKGRLIACEGANGGNRRISITDPNGNVRTLADRYNGKRFNSPNDLAIDKRGRVYYTDPRYVGDEPRELHFEGVFVVSPNGDVVLATNELQKPNGIAIAPDGKTVYVADNNSQPEGNHHLNAFRVRADGSLSNKRILFDFGDNRRGIDGMALDVHGNIYATAGQGDRAGVYVFTPDGRHLAFIPTPGTPTNCCFGGKEETDYLYITAGLPQSGEGPFGFGLYRIRLKSERIRANP